MRIEAQEALGDSFGTTSAPRGPQDRKRHEKLGSLAAPRSSQRNLKIVMFVLKFEEGGKKKLQECILQKSLILNGCCLHFGVFFFAEDHNHNEKYITICKFRAFGLLKMGMHFELQLCSPGHPKIEPKWTSKWTRMASKGSKMMNKRVFNNGMKKKKASISRPAVWRIPLWSPWGISKNDLEWFRML